MWRGGGGIFTIQTITNYLQPEFKIGIFLPMVTSPAPQKMKFMNNLVKTNTKDYNIVSIQ